MGISIRFFEQVLSLEGSGIDKTHKTLSAAEDLNKFRPEIRPVSSELCLIDVVSQFSLIFFFFLE